MKLNTDTPTGAPCGLEPSRYEGLFLEPAIAPYDGDDDDEDEW